jgi:hypothetical protein
MSDDDKDLDTELDDPMVPKKEDAIDPDLIDGEVLEEESLEEDALDDDEDEFSDEDEM